MSNNNKKYQRKGVSLKFIGLLISAFIFVISSTLVVSLMLISHQNEIVDQANENCIQLKESSNDIQAASDYLTAQVRQFVQNAEEKYMAAYFEEANVTKRREKALDKIHKLSENTSRHEEIHLNVNAAVNESMDLMDQECYAMKLICVANSIDYAEYPEIDAANIDGVDPSSRKDEALNAVLGTEYILKKDKITSHINLALEIIDELMNENEKKEALNLHNLILFQSVVIAVNVAFMIAVIITFFFYIVKPMNLALRSIEANEEIHVSGNREFNYLVAVYNEVRSQNEKVKEKLTFEAEHDKLTNLYNRTGYVSLFRRMRLGKTLYALIDIDGFKEINDKFGHDIGDRVLVKLAGLIEAYFKEDNAFAFRIGGDEFALLIENIDESEGYSVVSKFEQINQVLSVPKGAIPAFSLSVGIVHGDDDDTTDTLFKKADNALYKVKQSGKSGVIYDIQ